MLWYDFSWEDMNRSLFSSDRAIPNRPKKRVYPRLAEWTCGFSSKCMADWKTAVLQKKPSPAWVTTHESCILGAPGETCRLLGRCESLLSPALPTAYVTGEEPCEPCKFHLLPESFKFGLYFESYEPPSSCFIWKEIAKQQIPSAVKPQIHANHSSCTYSWHFKK